MAAETDQLMGQVCHRVLVTDEPVGHASATGSSTRFSAGMGRRAGAFLTGVDCYVH